MKRYLGAAAASFLALSCVPANSLTETGLGTELCQTWSDAHVGASTISDDHSSSWVFGYLDALSASVAQSNIIKGNPPRDLLSHLDRPAILKLVNIYCAGHPERTIQQAVAEVGAQLVAEDRVRSVRPTPRASIPAAVVVRPARVPAETTGSGDITGSIHSARLPACRTVIVANADGETLHRLRKCD